MDLQLNDHHILITGGSKGIGLACARAFAAEGARVAIASRSQSNLDSARAELAREGIDVFAVAADLSRPEAAISMVDATQKALGPVDVLVNSAGAAKRHSLDQYDFHTWQHGMEAKFFPYVNAMDAVREGMMARKRGVIVNIVGTGGKRAQPTHLAGGAANAALMLVTVGGVRVNVVNPAQTLTERLREGMAADARMNGITPEEALQRATARVPLGRLARPEEIADVVVFLASPRAGYVTGAGLVLDGAATPTVT